MKKKRRTHKQRISSSFTPSCTDCDRKKDTPRETSHQKYESFRPNAATQMRKVKMKTGRAKKKLRHEKQNNECKCK